MKIVDLNLENGQVVYLRATSIVALMNNIFSKPGRELCDVHTHKTIFTVQGDALKIKTLLETFE